MAEQQGDLKPATPARVAEELKKLRSQRASGGLQADEYEHRFSRMISELRDRRIDGSRAEILATLSPLLEQGILGADDWRRLTRQVGLAGRRWLFGPEADDPPPARTGRPAGHRHRVRRDASLHSGS